MSACSHHPVFFDRATKTFSCACGKAVITHHEVVAHGGVEAAILKRRETDPAFGRGAHDHLEGQ